jgi:siderophore synthetase component
MQPDLRLHAANMHFLRLIASALTEGLAGRLDGLTVVMASGSRREIGAGYAPLMRFLYGNGFTPIHSVTASAGRDYRDARDFLQNRLRGAMERDHGAAFSAANWDELGNEMADSVINETRALGAQTRLYRILAELVAQSGETSFFGYLTRSSTARAALAGLGHDTPSLLIQIGAFSGHRTHPCAKTRFLPEGGAGPQMRPLSAEEFSAYAPEAAPDVVLPILAARADRVMISLSRTLSQDYAGWFAASFPVPYAGWAAAVSNTGEFVPIPVHPLQVPAILARLAGPIAAGEILFPAGAAITQRPTISFRTFAPLDRPAEPQIKTTLAMLMTNDVRTVSPARSFNAPVLSDLLAEVAARDEAIGAAFRPLREPVAIAWGRDTDPAAADYKDGFHLGATFRANPAAVLSPGEIAIPLNTLLSASPMGGILLAEIMREAGVRTPAEAVGWFRHYVGTVLAATFGLLTRYGIGLEAHQQNTDLIFDRSGKLRALAYRDVSDIEICEPMLTARGIDIRPALHPFIRNLFPGIDRPLRQTMHTSFVSHLFPVVGVIAEAFAAPAPPLLVIVKEAIIAALTDARASIGQDQAGAVFHDALATIERRILAEPIETKCLLRKRATPAQDVSFTTIDNPLTSVGG